MFAVKMVINLVPSFIKGMVKDPIKKRKYRNICLEIFEAIKTAFADDEAFQ